MQCLRTLLQITRGKHMCLLQGDQKLPFVAILSGKLAFLAFCYYFHLVALVSVTRNESYRHFLKLFGIFDELHLVSLKFGG